MLKISEKLEQELIKELGKEIGHFSECGAVIGDNEFVLIYKDNDIYLAHKSEFEENGIFVRLKEKIK